MPRLSLAPLLLLTLCAWPLLTTAQVRVPLPGEQRRTEFETPADWERQAAAALDTMLGSRQGEFDQQARDATLHAINDFHADPALVAQHLEHARHKLRVAQEEQQRQERLAALTLDSKRRAIDMELRSFKRRAEADGVWTPEENEEYDRLDALWNEAWSPTPAEEKALAAQQDMRAGVVDAIRQGALQMGGLSPEEVEARRQNALMFDAATKTWRRATFTGQMVDEVQAGIHRKREVGIMATNVMIAAEIYMARTDITEEQRKVAQDVYDTAYRTRAIAADAISKDIAVVLVGTTADAALLGLGRPVGWVSSKIGGGIRAGWTRLFGGAAEGAAAGTGAGAAGAGAAGTGAATAEGAAARTGAAGAEAAGAGGRTAGTTAAEGATTIRLPHAEAAGLGARASGEAAAVTEAAAARALQRGRELGVAADELAALEAGIASKNPAIALSARQGLAQLEGAEQAIATARAAGVAEAEIQAALARARAAGTVDAFALQLTDDLAVALANHRGLLIVVAEHEARSFAAFTSNVPAGRVLQMDPSLLVRIDTKLRLLARGQEVVWSATERAVIDQLGALIRQGGADDLARWVEYSAIDGLTRIFRPDFVRLFEQAFGTATSRATTSAAAGVAEATASTVRLPPGAAAGAEATAPTVRLPQGAASAADETPTLLLGRPGAAAGEATAPTVRLGPEATAPTVTLPAGAAAGASGSTGAGTGARAGGAAAAPRLSPEANATGGVIAGVLTAGEAPKPPAAVSSNATEASPPAAEAPAASPTSFWSGSRFYRRHDIHINDFFYWSDGVSGGLDGASEFLKAPDPMRLNVPFLGAGSTVLDATVQKMASIIDYLEPVVVLAEGPRRPGVFGRLAGALGRALDALAGHAPPPALLGTSAHARLTPPSPAARLRLDPLAPVDTTQPARDGAPPLQMLVTSLGTSTGEAFEVHIVNDGKTPVEIGGASLILEPIGREVQRRVAAEVKKVAANAKLTIKMDAYCLEFLKVPPPAGTLFRIAPREVQEQFAPMRRILHAARQLQHTGVLTPDTRDERGYFHAIRQWAIWTKERGFTLDAFRDAFVEHTKKNFEATGQTWTAELGEAIGLAAPHRWNDITRVLQAAERLAAAAPGDAPR